MRGIIFKYANLFAVLHVPEGYHIQTCQNAEASQTSHVRLAFIDTRVPRIDFNLAS